MWYRDERFWMVLSGLLLVGLLIVSIMCARKKNSMPEHFADITGSTYRRPKNGDVRFV